MILHGDCLEVLRTLPANSVHMVVTSPPYWSLRDYGVPPTIWGGNPLCVHAWESAGTKEGYGTKKKWQHSVNGRGDADDSASRARQRQDGGWNQIEQGQFCAGCGAWRGCLGLEPTIELYIEHLVQIFDEVRRVLRKDGTCWLNLGDCYAAAGRGGDSGRRSGLQGSTRSQDESKRVAARQSFRRDRQPTGDVRHKASTGLKDKDLCMVPARVALALQASGWYLRADIVWAKTNPMPESTQDRPTKSHEYLFLLAKSRRYFYDAHAIREGATGTARPRGTGVNPKAGKNEQSGDRRKAGFNARWRVKQNASFSGAVAGLVSSRNRRSVWTIPTSPFKGAHFATFPPRLVEPCILAGTSEHGCCVMCGAPAKRIVKLGAPLTAQKVVGGCNKDGKYHGRATKDYAGAGAQDPSAVKVRILEGMRERITVGWKPTCKHSLVLGVEPCTVLDPFGGSGTTGLVAWSLGRAYILIELGEHNVRMAEERIAPAVVEVPA